MGHGEKSPSQLIDERIKALSDTSHLFNSSLEGNTRRAIAFHKGETIDDKALKDLARAAITLNASRAHG